MSAPELRSLTLPIQTRRLVLRDYVATDTSAVFSYVKEPSFWQFQRADAPTVEQVDTLLQ